MLLLAGEIVLDDAEGDDTRKHTLRNVAMPSSQKKPSTSLSTANKSHDHNYTSKQQFSCSMR